MKIHYRIRKDQIEIVRCLRIRRSSCRNRSEDLR